MVFISVAPTPDLFQSPMSGTGGSWAARTASPTNANSQQAEVILISEVPSTEPDPTADPEPVQDCDTDGLPRQKWRQRGGHRCGRVLRQATAAGDLDGSMLAM